MTPAEFRDTVVDPALRAIGLYSEAASELLLGTAIQESGLRDVSQEGGGPALGYFQMEIATYNDIWKNYLAYRPELAQKVASLSGFVIPSPDCLLSSPIFAAAMARIKYLRAPEPLPAAGDVAGMAAYWKRFYNTKDGAGTAEEYAANWNAVV